MRGSHNATREARHMKVSLRVPMFHHLGIWVWDTHLQSIEDTVLRARRNRYKWIAVKAQDGPTGYRLSTQKLEDWRNACRKHGVHFGIWGFLYGADAVAEAHVAVDLINTYHAEFYIADAESGYERRQQASEEFVSTFRIHHPHLPAALSSFGRIDLHPLDWHSWARHGFKFMPQAYFNESPMLHPATCIEVASRIWHPSDMAVTFEAEKGWSYGDDTRLAARRGVKGFNIWRADIASDRMLAEIQHNR